MSVACRTCRFFEDADEPTLPGAGLCRRYAPQRQWLIDPDRALALNWPIVNEADWCGEWGRAPKATPDVIDPPEETA